MNEDNGALSFATAIDTSGFDEGIQEIENKVSEVANNVEGESSRIKQLFTDIPPVNIDLITNASQSLATIDDAFNEIDRVVAENAQSIKVLETEYARLKEESAKAFMSGADGEYRALQQDMRAVEQLTKTRKDAIAYAERTADELLVVEQRLKSESAESLNTASSSTSLKARLKELTMQLVELEAAGKRNTEEFKQIQNEAAQLSDRMADARTQVSILANDEAGFKGVMSVISGVSGGFTALTGVMGLFGSENEDLQKVMMKLQSVMAITMGLQQVQQMLNKDSAASLVVLNGLKEWWNTISMEANAIQTESVATTTAETASMTAETAAEGTNTAAKVANTAATEANALAQKASASANISAATSEGVQTAAIVTETAAASAGSVANWTLASAFRAVGLAIKSIPIFGWIVAGISAIIGVVSLLTDSEEENTDAIKENEKELEKQKEKISSVESVYKNAASEQAKERSRIELLTSVLRDNTAQLSERKKALDELKKIIPSYNALLDNEGNLTRENTKAIDDYIAAMDRKAMAKAAASELEKLSSLSLENQIKQNKIQKRIDTNEWATQEPSGEEKYERPTGDIQFTSSALAERQRIDAATAKEEYEKANDELKDAILEAEEIQSEKKELMKLIKDENIQGDIVSGEDKSAKAFDADKASLNYKNAMENWKNSVKSFIKDANEDINSYTLDAMSEGLAKELAQVDANTKKLEDQWDKNLTGLATARKNSLKEMYMSQKGATESGWSKSADGSKSIDDYKKSLLEDEKIAKEHQSVLALITQKGEREKASIRQKYTDSLIDSYGTTEQKLEKLNRVWAERLKAIPSEYISEATAQMKRDISSLQTEDFKSTIDWDSVFGSMDKQSTRSLQFALDKVRTYFDNMKESMSTEDIKNFSEAISNMENEIASRNPFSAFAKSISDITKAKDEIVSAMNEIKETQDALNAAQLEYNDAKTALAEIQQEVDAGTLADNSERLASAEERLRDAELALVTAKDKSAKADNKALKAQNKATNAYKSFASQLKSVGSVVTGLGENAKNLASVFSGNVADGIETALNVIDSVMDAASDCITAISDTGKGVADALETTATSAGVAMQSTAAATAASISTVEKASVILTIISAVLQVATAIANAFTGEKSLQNHIDKISAQIEQLKWEFNNWDVKTFEENMGDSFKYIWDLAAETRLELMKAGREGWIEMASGTLVRGAYDSAEEYAIVVDKIADAYTNASYSADKLLGEDRWKSAQDQIKNLANQQYLIYKQIGIEQNKKHPEDDTIQEWKNQISELSQQMSSVMNDMLEDIIGGSSRDIATQLGDAFIEACKSGEDAMKAWGDKANEIVQNVLKQMIIAELLEKPIAQIFDKYKAKWFSDDGTFSIDKVKESINDFSNDINQVGFEFKEGWNVMNDNLKGMFDTDTRNGTTGGIATASQDSVDENNARLTTIQAHTYTLVQGVQELNEIGSVVLERLSGIETNTHNSSESLSDMRSQIRSMRNTLDDLQSRGIRIL